MYTELDLLDGHKIEAMMARGQFDGLYSLLSSHQLANLAQASHPPLYAIMRLRRSVDVAIGATVEYSAAGSEASRGEVSRGEQVRRSRSRSHPHPPHLRPPSLSGLFRLCPCPRRPSTCTPRCCRTPSLASPRASARR